MSLRIGSAKATRAELRYTPTFMNGSDLREFATDAIKFWEPWRLLSVDSDIFGEAVTMCFGTGKTTR